MNISIIGGGAVGLFFASQWSKDHCVTLWTRTDMQAEMIQRDGLYIFENGNENVQYIQSKKIGCQPLQADLIVVAVKQYNMKDVMGELTNAKSHSIMFIQNGMGHLDLLDKLPHHHIYTASVEHGLVKINGGTIQVNGRNKTNIGAFRGGTEEIIDHLQTDSFRFEWRENIHHMMIEKMAANAIINPLTAMLNVKNGQIAQNEHYRSIAKDLCREFASVFSYKSEEETFESVLSICKNTAYNESSMLKDVKEGRLTEIDAIVGVLVKEAEKKGCHVPLFRMIYNMIKGKENMPPLMSN
ncbi:ketopantoate reductase family protein [Domibacillus epiphyticus]|uniref:2-dehydropantoate 2-reductase n=1 Tax=Domibacillus epiphyticus TaxID=1714355 RepID=A0A1V2ACJ3_9BACI|nr:2-dehydropantoate 2-reductase [Domibacillus epiphyticus]OMP68514.1 hypothetical protein BTO28_00235 [Domibacillus epiphyticus]